MQALAWAGAISRKGGTASAQAGSATGQRVRKTQPEGGLADVVPALRAAARAALPEFMDT
jgi:hypothetical protein